MNRNSVITLILISIFVGYTAISIPELFVEECVGVEDCYDYNRRMARLHNWDISWFFTDFRHVVHMSLLVLSLSVFGNAKVLVLVSSLLLLVVSYLLSVNLTKSREAGIVTLVVILQSSVFFKYDTSVTYPSFWALLFVTSMYLVTTKWYASPAPYIFSIPAKALTAVFFPAYIIFVWLLDIPKSIKKKVTILYAVLFSIGSAITFIVGMNFIINKTSGFDLIQQINIGKFLEGFFSWVWKGFADDQITIVLLIFSTFILLTKMRNKPNVKAVVVFTWLLVFTSPFLIGFTTYDVWPYRMVVHVVGIALMTGFLVTDLSWTRSFLVKARSSPVKEEEHNP